MSTQSEQFISHFESSLSLPYALQERIKGLCMGKVCEVGCGAGRAARMFPSERYLGLDVKDDILVQAEEANPDHKFDLIMWDTLYPTADTYLFFATLMYLPNEDVRFIIKRLDHTVVIIDCVSAERYTPLFEEHGMELVFFEHWEYPLFPYYIEVMVFE